VDFSLTEEQSILADSVSRFIESNYDFETRQKIVESDTGFSLDMWRTFAELGWTAVPFAEDDGGLGGGAIELTLMMEQFGRGMVVEPFLANIVLAGGALRRAASPEQKDAWLAPLIGGELQAALAFAEPQARYDIADISTTAIADGDDFVLKGRKSFVLNGGAAGLIILPARTSGAQVDSSGITLFAVAADAEGISRRPYPTVDGQQAAEVELDNVVVPSSAVLGAVDGGYGLLRDIIDEATLAVAAEAIGIMQIMHDKTVDYSRNRVQFGVPIGTFQALQHRMVDTMIACEQSRSLLYWCVMLAAAGSPQTREAISALKYQVGTAGVHVAREAVQLHGGMGVTWELDIAHYFKRLTAIDLTFGNADVHLDRFAGLTG
jgi:alkylation response protein AidB-like acyl-CoA dehydrogenase